MNNNTYYSAIFFIIGLAIGSSSVYFGITADLRIQDKTIARLESEAKIRPVVTVDALGICRVTDGGRAYMLVDITREMQGAATVEAATDPVEDNPYRATEQEVEEVESEN